MYLTRSAVNKVVHCRLSHAAHYPSYSNKTSAEKMYQYDHRPDSTIHSRAATTSLLTAQLQ